MDSWDGASLLASGRATGAAPSLSTQDYSERTKVWGSWLQPHFCEHGESCDTAVMDRAVLGMPGMGTPYGMCEKPRCVVCILQLEQVRVGPEKCSSRNMLRPLPSVPVLGGWQCPTIGRDHPQMAGLGCGLETAGHTPQHPPVCVGTDVLPGFFRMKDCTGAGVSLHREPGSSSLVAGAGGVGSAQCPSGVGLGTQPGPPPLPREDTSHLSSLPTSPLVYMLESLL